LSYSVHQLAKETPERQTAPALFVNTSASTTLHYSSLLSAASRAFLLLQQDRAVITILEYWKTQERYREQIWMELSMCLTFWPPVLMSLEDCLLLSYQGCQP
jgi:hypothetical protein